jgi:hypothetical protein
MSTPADGTKEHTDHTEWLCVFGVVCGSSGWA